VYKGVAREDDIQRETKQISSKNVIIFIFPFKSKLW
jgi:putative NADPH-quinone reductase